MTILSYIPANGLNLKLLKPPRNSERLLDKIERILNNGLNGAYGLDGSKEYGRFFSESMQILKSDTDEDVGGHIVSFELMSDIRQLTKLYLSLCLNNMKDIDRLLTQQWLEVLEYGDTKISIGDKHFYETHQNMHGDVSICQYPLVDKAQGELFGKKWFDVSEATGDSIYCYQETLGLVAALLKSFQLGGGNKIELKNILQGIDGQYTRGANAADSGTKEDEIQFILLTLQSYQLDPKYLGIHIFAHYNRGYETAFNKNTKELEFWQVQKDDGNMVENKLMGISMIDIPDILKDLCILSGRSGDGPRILISEFIKSY